MKSVKVDPQPTINQIKEIAGAVKFSINFFGFIYHCEENLAKLVWCSHKERWLVYINSPLHEGLVRVLTGEINAKYHGSCVVVQTIAA